VEEGAVRAMLPLAHQAELERVVPCPATGQGTIGLTAPEVLAIADYVRKHLTRAEQERIRKVAAENSETIRARPANDAGLPPLPCPLQGPDNVCLAYAARPLYCRPLHARSVAGGMGTRSVHVADSSAESPDGNQHERSITQGVELGLTRALQSAGLDAGVYELNSALAKALATPDAATRWANGERLFDSDPTSTKLS
jgi:hypothetical protein